MKKRVIVSLDGLRRGEPIIPQPWLREARTLLSRSNLLNIYGPRRHGKSSLGNILLKRRQFGEYKSGTRTLPLRPGIWSDGRSATIGAKECSQVIEGIFHNNVGLPFRSLTGLSPQEMVAPVLDAIERYHKELRKLGQNHLRIVLDEADIVLHDPGARVFLSHFARAIQDRRDVKFIAISAWPMAVYNWSGLDCPVFPEVRVRKWDRETSRRYYDCVFSGSDSEKDAAFSHLYNYFGGCPFLLHRNSRGINQNDIMDTWLEYGSISEVMLSIADRQEGLQAVDMFGQLAQGQTLAPEDAFSRAAAMHLLIAGVAAETPEGHLVIAGEGFKEYAFDHMSFEPPRKGDIYPRSEAITIRFEPLMAARHSLSQRPKTGRESPTRGVPPQSKLSGPSR